LNSNSGDFVIVGGDKYAIDVLGLFRVLDAVRNERFARKISNIFTRYALRSASSWDDCYGSCHCVRTYLATPLG